MELERKKYCVGAFLDISQAFDKVWHAGLLAKLKPMMPFTYYLVIKSYLEERSFVVNQEGSLSNYVRIHEGVPQGSTLGPILYSIYTSDIPLSPNTTIATYADDTAILSSNPNPVYASLKAQHHLNLIHDWFKK